MNSITVRAMVPDDHERVNEIYNQRQVAAMTLQLPLTSTAERVARWVSSDLQRTLVVEVDGVVVANGGLTLYTRRRAHVGSIGMGVDEAFQRQGVGSALLSALIDLADNWYNLRRLELEVYTDNDPAIRLYERNGFVIEGRHRAYAYRDGEWADVFSMARLRDEPQIVG